MRTAPRALAGLLAILSIATIAVAGCGGDDDDDAAAGAADKATGSSGGKVVVDHQFGETTIDGTPETIVSLDQQWTDVLVALGEPPAAYGLDPNTGGKEYPWRGDGLADSEGISLTDGIPIEKVATAEPDLILVGWAAEDEAAYQRLADIAPTIPLLGKDAAVDRWQDMATVAGKFLGKEDAASKLVSDAAADIEALKAGLPGLAGKTYAMANFVPGDAIYVVADPEDGSVVAFQDLGLQITPTVLEQKADQGRAELSLENAQLLDADLLVLFTNGADPNELVGYRDLPAVRQGAAVVLDYTAVMGLNTPTPLSIPYSLEQIEPAPQAAAA